MKTTHENNLLFGPNHKITKKDYENLKAADQIKYDNRSFFIYMFDCLIDEHPIFSLIFKKSLKDPIDIRVLLIVTSFNITFATNALLFNDDYIDQRAQADRELRQSFYYTAAQEVLKTIISLAFSTTIDSIMMFIFHISDSKTGELNEAMKTKSIEQINMA